MLFPKLSPLQFRFISSLLACVFLLLVYLGLTKPTFAYAAEIDSRYELGRQDPVSFEDDLSNGLDEVEGTTDVKRRAAESVVALANNEAQNRNIQAGETQNWVFQKDAINGPSGATGPGLPQDPPTNSTTFKAHARHDLKRRQPEKTVYFSVTTCLQPVHNGSTPGGNLSSVVPPQLQIYFSADGSNERPGTSSSGDQEIALMDGGFAKLEVDVDGDSDFAVGVSAPNLTSFVGVWNYEIAASIDAPFHDALNNTNLYFVDGDNHAALLVTGDLTQTFPNSTTYQEWMALKAPYGMFAHNQNDSTIHGVRKSYCGLLNYAQIVVNLENVENQNVAAMTNRGLGGKPKEQFYINPLNATSSYYGFLAMEGNSTASGNGVVGGGGTVYAPVNFTTKTDANCALMYNLSFCSEVAYAVPSNPEKYSERTGLPQLAALYDSYAGQMYQYFNYSLQQIPCDTTASAQYSLARTCDDCARAYKQWLCAVTIPRCEDWNNPAPWLKERNMAQAFVNRTMPAWIGDQEVMSSAADNSSRNGAIIDDTIQPGPYKEVLPCADLCFDLVQSCPAALGFGCPIGPMMDQSYGQRSKNGGNITCSYLGAAYYLSAAPASARSMLKQSLSGLPLTALLTAALAVVLSECV